MTQPTNFLTLVAVTMGTGDLSLVTTGFPAGLFPHVHLG